MDLLQESGEERKAPQCGSGAVFRKDKACTLSAAQTPPLQICSIDPIMVSYALAVGKVYQP